MFLRLFLLFTIIPLIELYILIKIGTAFGALTAIAIVLLTGASGAMLARHHGFKTWSKIQRQMQQGIIPGEDLLDGLLILIAGVVLITPGIITDVLGFSLLIPLTRQLYKKFLKKRLKVMMQRQEYSFSDVFRQERMRRVDPHNHDDRHGSQ